AGTLRSDQGGALAALYAVPNAAIQPILGRPLSNSAPNVTVNLIEPGTSYGDRVNEIDVRFAKILRYGRTRTNVGVDIYNITNSSPVLTYNQNFSPAAGGGYTWLTPTSALCDPGVIMRRLAVIDCSRKVPAIHVRTPRSRMRGATSGEQREAGL